MADQLFKKRKAKKKSDERRQAANRKSYDRVLIVCEGSQTEPNYFCAIRDDLQLVTTRIRICGEECGSDPCSVVDFALEKYRDDPDFDRVFCVIDRDSHASFDRAINKVRDTKLEKGHKIEIIASWPCFEIWFLLHFTFSTRQYPKIQKKSPCDLVIARLKEYIPDYAKSSQISTEIYACTKNHIDTAKTNARGLKKYNQRTRTTEPSTDVHLLVEYLEWLAEQKTGEK